MDAPPRIPSSLGACRRLAAVATSAALLGAACSGTPPDDASAQDPPIEGRTATGYFADVACSLPERELLRIWNGYYPGRTGEIYMVPKEPNTFEFAHEGPWDYLQEVPLLFYGPGHVPERGAVTRPATMPDVAPTIAAYLDFDFDAPDGSPLPEALPAGDEPPGLVLLVVLDGAGWGLLRAWPDDWPVLKSLISDGVWFERFTVGSTPSVTPPVHTTLGTGAYPRRHGLVNLHLRINGEIRPSHGDGPRYVLTPSLADLYGRARGNEPKVGVLGFDDWHLGMIGQGAYIDGGSRHLAATLDLETAVWTLEEPNDRYFRFPRYINDIPGLDEAVDRLDAADGSKDGKWLDAELDDPVILRRSPAFTEWHTRILDEVIGRERFGAGKAPDLLFTNYKQIDDVGHVWGMNSPQMQQVLRASDRAIEELIGILDRRVGVGRWVMVITADHGMVADPSVSGGFMMNRGKFRRDLAAEFGSGVIQEWRPTMMWMDEDLLDRNGHSLEDVAQFILRYTAGQNVRDPDSLPPEERSERLFAAAFPSRVLESLPCLPEGSG
jgi:predicted AlkP superfamily pyrophosphatase or phosphodiesterase